MIKQLISASTVALGLVAMAGTVGAAGPDEFTDTAAFVDVNPCTGQLHEVSITFQIRQHLHRNNEVVTIVSSTATSEGHVGAGTQTLVITSDGQLRTTFNDMVEHPETGEKFSVKGHQRIDTATGQIVRDRFEMRCIRATDRS